MIPNRFIAPPTLPLENLDFIPPEYHTFPNNITSLIIHERSQPIIVFELIFNSGKWIERKDGLAVLTAQMLKMGTANKSSKDIAFAFEYLGTFFNINVDNDNIEMKFFCLEKKFQDSLDILKEILLEPLFPSNELSILSQILTSKAEAKMSNNSYFATQKFKEFLFGKKHPLGKITDPKVYNSLTQAEVISFYESYLFNNPKIVVSGFISNEILNSISEFCQNLSIYYYKNSIVEKKTLWGKHTLNRESNQISLRIGAITIDNKDEKYQKLKIANVLLGGFFGSRLMKSIREEKGFTYGIYTSLFHTQNESYWMLSSEMQKDKIDEGLKEIHIEIEKLARQRPEVDTEMEILKNYLRGNFLNSFSSLFSRIDIFKKMFLNQQPHEYINIYLENLNTIQPRDITELIYKHYFKPKKVYFQLT